MVIPLHSSLFHPLISSRRLCACKYLFGWSNGLTSHCVAFVLMGGWAFHGVGFGYFLRVRKVWAKWEIVLCGNAYEGRDAGHNGG